MDLNLLQREVAVIIGVDKASVENWEYGHNSPGLRAWPGITKFPGYDPKLPGQTIGEKLRRHRAGLGMSWQEAARVMDVDPSTVTNWKLKDDRYHNHLCIARIIRFLGYNPLPEPKSLGQYIRQVWYAAGFKETEFAARLGSRKTWFPSGNWTRGSQPRSNSTGSK